MWCCSLELWGRWWKRLEWRLEGSKQKYPQHRVIPALKGEQLLPPEGWPFPPFRGSLGRTRAGRGRLSRTTGQGRFSSPSTLP